MKLRPLLLTLAVLVALPCPAPTLAQQGSNLNMQNVEIRAFIQDVARATGTTFIVDPRVQGSVSVSREDDLSREDLLGVLLAVLRNHGLIAVPAGNGIYRVVTDDTAAQQPGSALTGSQGFATQVFPLRNVDARVAAETLKPLVGRGGVISATPQGNALLVADYADNLKRLQGLVAQLDRDSAGMDTVTLRNTSARELSSTLNGVFGAASAKDRLGPVSIMPVESSNSLIVRGDPALVQKVSNMAVDLDRRAERSGDVAVVRLQHASAEQLLPVMQQLVGQTVAGGQHTPGATDTAAPAPSAGTQEQSQIISPAGGKRPTIVRYPGSNALIINADPETQRTLLDVIRQLDVRREQVLVEAIVVEISDEAAKQLGVQFLLAGKNGNIPFTATQYPNSGAGLFPIAGAIAGGKPAQDGDEGKDGSWLDLVRQQAASSLLGLTGSLTGIAGSSGDAVFGAIITAVKRDTSSNLLSTPSIMTLDNEQARILVGQEVPITTGEVLGDANSNPFRTIERENVGIELEVTPQINAGGGITLQLKQEVSAVAGPVSETNSELILNKREIQTRVLVDNGAIVVLGGLLDQSDRHSVDKIPLLGDIPGLGALFRSSGRQRERTNLMIFLRPTIIGDRLQAQRETASRYGYMRDQQLLQKDVVEAPLDQLLRDYLRAQAPVAPPAAAPSPAPVAPKR